MERYSTLEPDLSELPYMKMGYYGRPGVGKSWLAASFADDARTLLIDVENGAKRIRFKQYIHELNIIKLDSFTEFNDVYNKLSKHLELCDKRDKSKATEKDLKDLVEVESWITNRSAITIDPLKIERFMHVVIDSLSETQHSSMDFIVPQNDLLNMKRPQIQDWGKNIDMIRFVIKAFKELPINAHFVCLEKVTEEYNDKGEIINTRYGLKFSGQLAEDVAAMIDNIAHMTTKKKGMDIVRVLTFQNESKLLAKDRFDVFGKEQINMSGFDLMEIVRREVPAAYEREKQEVQKRKEDIQKRFKGTTHINKPIEVAPIEVRTVAMNILKGGDKK